MKMEIKTTLEIVQNWRRTPDISPLRWILYEEYLKDKRDQIEWLESIINDTDYFSYEKMFLKVKSRLAKLKGK